MGADGDLATALRELDGRSYGEYRRIGRRRFPCGALVLEVEHVQGDPYAAPSRVRVDVGADVAALPSWSYGSRDARRAAADYLHRALAGVLRTRGTLSRGEPREARRGRRGGSGGSGKIEIAPAGQEVLERTSVVIDPDGRLRVRLSVGLPAAGRRILGRAAATLLAEELPAAMDLGLASVRDDDTGLRAHVAVVEDQVALRGQLRARGLVAFLAAGAVLPRASGVDDRPLDAARPLVVPDSLAVELEAPHTGPLRGLGVPVGVTLIAGGGYHGKSTLLDALARAVYDHVPGDGRHLCVADPDAVSIRAEDGRSVRGVDLRPFIADLPLGRSTARFDTEDASGSTSQAAAIVEALEAGARVLLIDEDTAATNFMIRDARMRRLVPEGKEPITPFLDRVRQLYEERSISSVLVVGGAGDYLDVADTVVRMDTYEPQDATREAGAIAAALPLSSAAAPRAPGAWPPAEPRRPRPASFDPSRGRRRERVRSRSTRAIEFGEEEIDVSLVAQLLDPAQCRLIGDALLHLSRGGCDGRTSLEALLDALEEKVRQGGLEALAEASYGDRALARRHEIAAAINRLRSLRMA